MTYGWLDPLAGTREGESQGKQFPQLIILLELFDGSEEVGEAQGVMHDEWFPREQHPKHDSQFVMDLMLPDPSNFAHPRFISPVYINASGLLKLAKG